MEIPIYQVDAFSPTIFGGNPAAVCPLEEWLEDGLMQNIASENYLAETAFFVREDDGYHLRWFTPVKEVDLCGHATLATAHVLFNHLAYAKEEVAFQTRSGRLTVRKDGEYYVMNFPADHIQEVPTPDIITEALGIKPIKTFLGREDYLVILPSQKEVEALVPDFRKLAMLENSRGTIATARGNTVDFVSRCFFPLYGIDEDPTTGSAHTTLTVYWAKELQKENLTALQLSDRVGTLRCNLINDRVEIIGQAKTYLIGQIIV